MFGGSFGFAEVGLTAAAENL